MSIEWFSLPNGEWEGLDARFTHLYFWIGRCNDCFILEMCSPEFEGSGITIATKPSLPEVQVVATGHAELVAQNTNVNALLTRDKRIK